MTPEGIIYLSFFFFGFGLGLVLFEKMITGGDDDGQD
jgi:hypothetical protein